MKNINNLLKSYKDEKYRLFSSKLIPNINQKYIIGVRSPILKDIAKNMDDKNIKKYFLELPHKYHEENMLHGYLINRIKNYEETIKEINNFLPYVDNWAVCDTIKPKSFNKNHNLLIKDIKKWLKSKDIYKRRLAVNMLMTHFLNDDFKIEYLELVKKVKNDDYYIMMMCAWYYATALAKQYDSTIIYFNKHLLDKEVHNKAIQKAIESYRINNDKKEI